MLRNAVFVNVKVRNFNIWGKVISDYKARLDQGFFNCYHAGWYF